MTTSKEKFKENTLLFDTTLIMNISVLVSSVISISGITIVS